MKIIIAGSRDIKDFSLVCKAIARAGFGITVKDEIVSGCAKGVDILGEKYGQVCRMNVKRFPANWNKYGKRAGYIRNLAMAIYADALIAVWDGKSKGTKHMIDIAKRKGLKVFVYENN